MRGWKEKDEEEEEENWDGQNNSTNFPPKAAICSWKKCPPCAKGPKKKRPILE